MHLFLKCVFFKSINDDNYAVSAYEKKTQQLRDGCF